MSLARIALTAFYALGTLGTAVTAYEVLPQLWETDVLNCFIVAIALGVMALLQVRIAITGYWQ